ncbi:MAG: hypothetical protein MUF23_00935 [Pirellula sp.]|jgi:hypothetical protein|nr:hypothetical protein [Pirellula sp.]
MIRRSINLLGVILVLAGPIANAHEGHGHTRGDTPMHYVTEPMHWMPFAVAALFLAAFAWWGSRKLAPAAKRKS